LRRSLLPDLSLLVNGPGERGREAGLAGTARLDRITGGELFAGSEFRCTVKLKDFIADFTGAVILSSPVSEAVFPLLPLQLILMLLLLLVLVLLLVLLVEGVGEAQEPSLRLVGGVRELNPIFLGLRGLEGREEVDRCWRSRLDLRSVAR